MPCRDISLAGRYRQRASNLMPSHGSGWRLLEFRRCTKQEADHARGQRAVGRSHCFRLWPVSRHLPRLHAVRSDSRSLVRRLTRCERGGCASLAAPRGPTSRLAAGGRLPPVAVRRWPVSCGFSVETACRHSSLASALMSVTHRPEAQGDLSVWISKSQSKYPRLVD